MTLRTLLHVGCGRQSIAGTTWAFNRSDAWREIRLDIDPAVSPDVVGSITDMPVIASGSVDAIYSSHNIEHLYPHEHALAFKEFLRVLKPAGFAVIGCPDLQTVCEVVAAGKLLEPMYQSPAGPISAIDTLYGHRASLARGFHHMAHRSGFISKSLHDGLIESGFAAVAMMRRRAAIDLWALAFKATATPIVADRIHALASIYLPGVFYGPFLSGIQNEIAKEMLSSAAS